MNKFTISNKVSIDINKSNKDFIPKSETFIDNQNVLETIGYAINEDLPVLLIGETGTGKTSAIRFLANKTNNAFRRLNLNGQTTVDELVGKILVNEKGTYWSDGILVDAMRNGHWILLDEINAALPEVLFVLQSLLDDDKYIVLSDKPAEVNHATGEITKIANEILRPHPNFRLFASMNPSDNYAGTKDLNKAFMSRFPIVLEVKYPEKNAELEIISARFPNEDQKQLEKLISFGNQLRKTYFDGKMDFIFSTRELINWVKVNQFSQDWKKSAEISFLAKCNQEDKDTIESLLKLNFKQVKSSAYGLKIGDRIIISNDIKIPNQNIILPSRTVVQILDFKTIFQQPNNINAGMTCAVVNVVSTDLTKARKINPQVQIATPGDTWAVLLDNLENNYYVHN